MEPVRGVEPLTCCLRNSCSATELHRLRCGFGGNPGYFLNYESSMVARTPAEVIYAHNYSILGLLTGRMPSINPAFSRGGSCICTGLIAMLGSGPLKAQVGVADKDRAAGGG